MRTIPLGTEDAFAIVDDEDFDALSVCRWHLSQQGYAIRNTRGRQTLMHRVLLGLEVGNPLQTDHINRNRLDNRRCNLRVCTNAENGQNRNPRPGKSKYRGVCLSANGPYWVAEVKINYQRHYIGTFKDEKAAGIAAQQFRLEHMPFTVEDLIV